MSFNDIERQRIKNVVGGFCSKRSPAHLKDQLRFEYEIEKQSVIIYEIRPMWNNPTEVYSIVENHPLWGWSEFSGFAS